MLYYNTYPAMRLRSTGFWNRMRDNTEILLATSNLGVFRDGRWLVRGVDLSVKSGEIVTLIGPNGSGKTTTVRAALGLLAPDEGSVRRSDNCRVGYVPQKLAIDRSLPLTVSRFMQLTGPLTKKVSIEALEQTGVAHLAGAVVHDLSGGEFQRAMLARAFARNPDLLVLDEPVQGVDFSGEEALYRLIGEFRDRTGCGILMISHDLHVVMAATNTVICLNGHVCCSGTPENVAASPDYARLFGPQIGDSIAIYRHKHDHTHLPDGRVQHADGTITDDHHSHGDHCDHDRSQSVEPAAASTEARR